jgi:proline iminopeptidase
VSIRVNGVDLFVARDGSGPPCLVLHGGLGVDHTMYRASLNGLVDGHELIYFDQRGNGRSGRPPLSTMTMEQLADDAAALVGRLDLPPPVVLGHSFGGFVAQELVLRHPASVRALILVDTSPGQLGAGEDPEDGRGADLPAEAAAVLAEPPTDDDALAAGMRRLLPFYLHQRDVAEVAGMMSATVFSRDAMVRGFELLAGWSAVDRLHAITTPTLVIVGRHDVFTSPPQARRIASRIAGARLVEFADSGHFPWLDEPDRFRDVVSEWLAGLPSA